MAAAENEITVGGTQSGGYRALSSDGVATAPTSFWGALWDAALARRGILSQRLYQSQLDAAAQDQVAAAEADDQIATQIAAARESATTDTDLHQLDVLESRQNMLRKLLGHPSAKVRAYAEAQMLDLNNQVGTYWEDVEGRQETVQDQERTLRSTRRDEYRKNILDAQDAVEKVGGEADAIISLANDLGADNDAVQQRFREFVGQKREGEGSTLNIRIPGLGQVGGDEQRYTYDQIVKGTNAVRTALTAGASKRMQMLASMAQKDGFQINTENGGVELEDLNVPPPRTNVAPNRKAAATADATNAANASPYGRSIGGKVANTFNSILGGAPQAIGEGIAQGSGGDWQANLRAYADRIHRKYEATRRRPTN